MSQRRPPPIAFVIVAVIIVFVMMRNRRGSGPAPTQPAGSVAVQRSPQVNPIHKMLQPPDLGPRRDGVAVAVVVDVSGSMRRSARGGPGEPAKIDVARQCVLDLVRQTDAFADEHPDQEIVLGLYEFSARKQGRNCRTVLPFGPPDPAAANRALQQMRPDGGTPIGDAIIKAKRELDSTGLDSQHLLVVTDGQNTQGYAPADVADAMNRLRPEHRPSLYLIAFDTAASQFDDVKAAGGLVLGAANQTDLQQTLDYVLTGKILVEQPE